ncbi:hypothetical protein FPSE5266_20365 [Fusarium pseudograminearum]|nr:hypothetical protein FPSE5266_20365 [Fusarium pseudograminearum]
MVLTKEFTGNITPGGLAALGGWVELHISDDGNTFWSGNAHDSGADSYHFRCVGTLTPRQGSDQSPMVLAIDGYVAGALLPGSHDFGWRQPPTTSPPTIKSLVAEHYDDFAQGTFTVLASYSSTLSDFGDFVFTILGIALAFSGGSGTAALSDLKKRGKLGQVEGPDTNGMGDSTTLASVHSNTLLFSGPENTLAFTSASEAAKAGTQRRQLPQEEYDWANNAVFLGTLPPRSMIFLTDTTGEVNWIFSPQLSLVSSNAFASFHDLRGLKIFLNMGPNQYQDPRVHEIPHNDGRTLIKLLTHAWQIHHLRELVGPAVIMERLIHSQFAEVFRSGSRSLNADLDWSTYTLQQQADIVANWFTGTNPIVPIGPHYARMSLQNPLYRYIRDDIREGRVPAPAPAPSPLIYMRLVVDLNQVEPGQEAENEEAKSVYLAIVETKMG